MCEYTNLLTKKKIYLDFESNKAGNIYLFGYRKDNLTSQVITDGRLSGLAIEKNLPLIDPINSIKNLLDDALKEDRVIVAYSTAEREIFKKISGATNLDKYKNIPYLNIAKATKNWVKKCHRNEFENLSAYPAGARAFEQRRARWSLASIMRLTEMKADTTYARGRTTARLNTVINALSIRNNNFSSLTPVQKGKATKALKHNKFDIESIELLYKLIEKEKFGCFKTRGVFSTIFD